MTPKAPSSVLPKRIERKGTGIPGADDRQRKIVGFDHDLLAAAHVVCVGAGGIVSAIAPTLCRKGVGAITLIDNDFVEASNLNRQKFYVSDIGQGKAVCLIQNLQDECIASTTLWAIPSRFEDAVAAGMNLQGSVGICGVDNNAARVAASRYYRKQKMPVVFAAVSKDADHGYVFVQEAAGPCLGCLRPDIVDDDYFPCPGTPAIADILQAVGALAVYAIDSLLMERPRNWNYRRVSLSGQNFDGASMIPRRQVCPICSPSRPPEQEEGK